MLWPTIRRMRLFSIGIATAAVRPYMSAARTTPPVARRAPHSVTFGRVQGENRGPNPMEPLTVTDDYFWLRDDTRSDEEILGLLRDENDYSQHCTRHLEGFRATLYDEMLSHVKENDDSYPSPAADGYEYYSRTLQGASFKQYLRRPRGGGAEECILDVNAVALTLPEAQQAQCAISEVVASPSGALLAYTLDGSGYETYDILLKDLSSGGTALGDRLEATGGGIAWADERTLFYIRQDGAHRPFQVWRHRLGTRQDEDSLVYEDADELFNVHVSTSRDGALIFIESESKETTEVRFIPTDQPTAPPVLVRERVFGVRYDVDSHAPSRSLYLTSNADGCYNRELRVASLERPSEWLPLLWESEAPVLPHSRSRSLDGVFAFDDFVAVTGREGGFTQIWVVRVDSATGGAASVAQRLGFEEEAFTAEVWGVDNRLFACDGRLRIEYSSMTAPRSIREYDVASRTATTLRVQPVPNYDPSRYATRRVEVTARDGVQVPVTLLWRPDLASVSGDSPCPLHLYGYGSYGVCIDPSFAASRLALVDRGIVYAIAHVRGGGEMGHHGWYEAQGKYLAKRNTFHDFVDCAQALCERGVARRGALTCEGRSAGGLLVGNAVNLAPELFAAAVAGVPFVDLMVTMCDPSIPLTTEEWEEWGNPNEETYYDYMRSYSPIDNVRTNATYPAMLIVSGLNDPRVAYWEPTKWAQVLRATIANGDDVLVKMDLAAGHFSASDRYRYLRELAFDYAWLLDKLGKAAPLEGASAAAKSVRK